MPDESPQPKYSKPKILLIDMSEECSKALESAGYNTSTGTFGTPYPVERSRKFHCVDHATCRLPNYQEQEIIFANTSCTIPAAAATAQHAGYGVKANWQDGSKGEIDPRPICMSMVSRGFDQILAHGGIFIIFVATKYEINYLEGFQLASDDLFERRPFTCSSWSFLPALEICESTPKYGTEISFDSRARQFTRVLERGAGKAHFECVLKPDYRIAESWISIAKNKYGQDIAAFLAFKKPTGNVLILPQMPEVHAIIVDLIEDWCAQWNPSLFPEHEGAKWVHRAEYEMPEVTALRSQIESVRKAADDAIDRLEKRIVETQTNNSDWYTLLNGTGDTLAAAVMRTLRQLGFRNVIDVDEESREKGEGTKLKEDIQIRDRHPILIVDVKGVNGHPEDAEAAQAEKHALMRAAEFNGKVKPLTIINHQRNLPPHERDRQAYRKEIIDNAVQTGLGLMTTWDLFRLLRNKDALRWPASVVTPIFYRSGRIEPIPEHYREIGEIVRVWEHAFGIIPTQAVDVGRRLAIEVGDLFIETEVKSLQVDGAIVKSAPVGSNCGVRREDSETRLREGMRVFLVRDDLTIP